MKDILLPTSLIVISLIIIFTALAILPRPYPVPPYIDPCPGHHIKNLCD